MSMTLSLKRCYFNDRKKKEPNISVRAHSQSFTIAVMLLLAGWYAHVITLLYII